MIIAGVRMEVRDRRKHERLEVKFRTLLSPKGLNACISGVAKNLSQGGAFIKTENWSNFQINEKAAVAFFLPPSFSNLNEVLGLEGTAELAHIDQLPGGIGLRFTKEFKNFKWMVSNNRNYVLG
jgi:hypothetical protein